MKIERLDHLVLTVKNMKRSCEFYSKIFDVNIEVLPDGRRELKFGNQKINLQQEDKAYGPKSNYGRSWNGNLFFITRTPMKDILRKLAKNTIPIEDGPGMRSGAMGQIHSVYFHDPEKNLIEVSNYETELK